MKKLLAMLLTLCLLISGFALAEEAVKPTKVALADSKTVTVYIGTPVELGYEVSPEGADASLLKWSTSSKKIATVADGVVTPVKEGTATITVKTPNGKKDSVKVKVVDPYKPTKVVLDMSGTISVSMGQTLELKAALQPETAKSELKWTTSSKKIAVVDENGVVTPVKEGTATITVKTPNGKKDSVKVKVVDPYKPTKVVLDMSGTISVSMGQTLELKAALQPETAQSELKWTTSSKKIAVVDENGVVTPVKEGTATITVKTPNGKKDTVKVKVVDPYKPAKVVLEQSGTVTLSMGEVLELNAALLPESAQSKVTWTTSSKKVAVVDENGVVTPVKEGTATITVKTANGKKDTVKVKVVDPYKPTKVTLDRTGSIGMEKGETVQLTATLYPETAKTTLTWKSSDPKVASVDGNGLVTCHKSGSVSISVVTANGKKATVKVKGIGEAMPKPGASNDLLGFLGRPVSELEDFVGKLTYDSKYPYVFELRGEISGQTSDQKYNKGWSGGRVIYIDLEDRSGHANGHTKKYTLAGINLENYQQYGRDERKVIIDKLEKDGWKLDGSGWSMSDVKFYRYVKTLADRETGNKVNAMLILEFVGDGQLFSIKANATLVK